MKNKQIILIMAILSVPILISGCATTMGTKIEQSIIESIEKGQTTKDEVIALLGEPMTQQHMGDGKELMVWSYVETLSSGLLIKKTTTDMSTLQVILNKDHVVEDYIWDKSLIEGANVVPNSHMQVEGTSQDQSHEYYQKEQKRYNQQYQQDHKKFQVQQDQWRQQTNDRNNQNYYQQREQERQQRQQQERSRQYYNRY